MIKPLTMKEVDEERIKELTNQIFSMECAYDDLMTNYADEYEALKNKLRELQSKNNV